MATTRLMPIHVSTGKSVLHSLKARMDYYRNGDKTEEGKLLSGYECDPETAEEEFMLSKQEYHNSKWSIRKNEVIAYQIRQSFKPGEITPEKAHKLGIQFAKEMWGDDYQIVITTHLNTNHVHNHFVVNSVSFTNGKKYNYSNSEMARLRSTNDLICEEHNISHLEEKLTPRKHIDFNYYYYHS